MSEAIDAIIDINDALEEYGSDITLSVVTEGAFNPITGETSNTSVNTELKAFIGAYSSIELINSDIHANDIEFRFYYNGEISYEDIIVFQSNNYKIMNINKKILQSTNIMYSIRGRA